MISIIRVHNLRLPRAVTSAASCLDMRLRCFSSSDGIGNKRFRPRRRPDKKYRPIVIKKTKKKHDFNPVELGDVKNPSDELEETFGPAGADVIRDVRREMELREQGMRDDPVEQELRMANYLAAPTGSLEDMVYERRALALEIPDEKEREEWVNKIESEINAEHEKIMGLDEKSKDQVSVKSDDASDYDYDDETRNLDNELERDPDTEFYENQLAHGVWSEMLVTVDRNVKLWRGGRLESYRALVIGGNLNGCGGFGVGKSVDPVTAVDIAGRISKRNIFFVDRYQNDGLTRDLVGKQNSCKIFLRATENGLRGNLLCREILKRFGITNCAAKTHGNRNPFNIVRGTFKALMTHESIEDIALKRGKRIVSMDRARRMQI